MDKEQLIKQINIFLNESPFEDDEIFFWQKNMQEMDEKELEELFELLKEKLKIITDANDLFIKIAEDELQERDKRQSAIPVKASIVDMTINDLAGVFKNSILERLKDENIDIFSELDKYFNNSKLLGEDVVKSFDSLIKALYENKNIFTRTYEDLKSVKVGDWLKFYNVFNDQPNRTSIDRISFASGHEKARKLDQERKDVLLKLLKLYDFLLNPESVEIGTRSPLSQRGGRGDFSEAGVGNIGLTVATRDRLENNSSASESMGDTSGLYRREIPLTPFGKGGTKKDSASESMGDTSGLYRREIPLTPFTKGGTKKDSVAKNSPVSQEAGRIPLENWVAGIAKKAYVFSFDEQEIIKQNEDDIKRIARGNIILVGKELTKALETKNRPRVIAALRLAVKNNLLLGWAEKNMGERIKNQESGIMNGGEGKEKKNF